MFRHFKKKDEHSNKFNPCHNNINSNSVITECFYKLFSLFFPGTNSINKLFKVSNRARKMLYSGQGY